MIRAVSAIAAGAFSAMTFVSSAEAARCPSGQIYRVSKKTCMDKALAIKLGIIKSRKSNKAAVRKRSGKPAANLPAKTPLPAPRPKVDAARSREPAETGGATSAATPAMPVAGSRPEISPVPIRKVKPVYIRPTPGPDLAPGMTAKPNPALPSGEATPSLVAKPVVLPPTILNPKKPKFKPIPVKAPVAAAVSDPGTLNRLKDKLEQHVEKNRGKLTKRALPDS